MNGTVLRQSLLARELRRTTAPSPQHVDPSTTASTPPLRMTPSTVPSGNLVRRHALTRPHLDLSPPRSDHAAGLPDPPTESRPCLRSARSRESISLARSNGGSVQSDRAAVRCFGRKEQGGVAGEAARTTSARWICRSCRPRPSVPTRCTSRPTPRCSPGYRPRCWSRDARAAASTPTCRRLTTTAEPCTDAGFSRR